MELIVRHALRNSLITVTTVIGLEFGLLISGAAVTESVFGIPGHRPQVLDAVLARDYPLIQGAVLFTAAAYVVLNLAVDLTYSLRSIAGPQSRVFRWVVIEQVPWSASRS